MEKEKPIERKKYEILTAEVEIRGLRPLLMSSPKEMNKSDIENPSTVRQFKSKATDPMAEAEKRAYRDKDDGWTGDLCVPARCVERCLEVAASKFKVKRGEPSYVMAVKGSVSVIPENIPILDGEGKKQVKNYKANSSKVIVKATKGSIIRHRPQIDEWTLIFRIRWIPQLYALNEARLQMIIERAGFEGLLDWRPKYGIFELIRFDVVEEQEA